MRLLSVHSRQSQRGSALLIVLGLGAVALIIFAGTLRWTAGTTHLTDQSVRHAVTVAAAEAATELVLAEIGQDFAQQGAGVVNSKMPTYRTRVPKAAQHPHWGRFRFSNGQGNQNETRLQVIQPWTNGAPLISQYNGLKGYAATFRVTSNARDLESGRELLGAVQQDVQLALIPIYQFAIFYNLNLEIHPGAPMVIGGRVHANANIYTRPGSPLTFQNDVTSTGEIIPDKHPLDPLYRTGGSVQFLAEHDSGVTSLNLPIGTANTPEAVRQIVEIPPNNESPNSDLGRQRFYNNADLVIVVTDNNVSVRGGGVGNGNGPNLSWASVSNFVRLDRTLYDKREQKTIKLTEINVAGLVAWNAAGNNALRNALGRDIHSVYVADNRSRNSTTGTGVRLINGASLPPLGLTVATPNPLYVLGHYNATGSAVGTTNTASTKPAAIVADAITILSGSWQDTNSAKPLANRSASHTTVNAAFLAGIVETGNGYYSGGVENFPRFLENWSSRNLTYNGSMIVLYRSQYATAPWRGTGTGPDIYNPPNRNWYFDRNFLDPAKLPPLTPSVRAMIRGQWRMIPPNT